MRKLFGTCVIALGLVTACSGGAEDSTEAHVASEREALVLSKCDYRYECPLAGDSAFAKEVAHRDAGVDGSQSMMKLGGACKAEHIRLEAGGRASYSSDGSHAISWKLGEDSLTFCEGDTCIECTMIDAPPSTSSSKGASGGNGTSGGRCKGSASSCYDRPAGSCGAQDGCYAGWHVRWNGDLEFECKGSAEGCHSFRDERSCEKQSGCSWE